MGWRRGREEEDTMFDSPSSTTRRLFVLAETMPSSPWMLPASSLTLAS